jgi:hypothetical protein
MQPEDSLLCSQQPATGPYPEADESSPHLLTVFQRSILILSSHAHLDFRVVFPSGFQTILYVFLISYASYMPRPCYRLELDLPNNVFISVNFIGNIA